MRGNLLLDRRMDLEKNLFLLKTELLEEFTKENIRIVVIMVKENKYCMMNLENCHSSIRVISILMKNLVNFKYSVKRKISLEKLSFYLIKKFHQNKN
jgi:hypothetical protein